MKNKLLLLFLSCPHILLAVPGLFDSLQVQTRYGLQVKYYDYYAGDTCYAVTSDGHSTVFWNLNNGMILSRLNVGGRVRVSPVVPWYAYVGYTSYEKVYTKYNLLNGEPIGFRKEKDLEPVGLPPGWQVEQGMLVKRLASGKKVGFVGGGTVMPAISSIALSSNDDLLVAVSNQPQLWDLRHATMSLMPSVADYVQRKQLKNSGLTTACFAHDGTIWLAGSRLSLSRWTLNGKLLNEIRNYGTPEKGSLERFFWLSEYKPGRLRVATEMGLCDVGQDDYSFQPPMTDKKKYLTALSPLLADNSFYEGVYRNDWLVRSTTEKTDTFQRLFRPHARINSLLPLPDGKSMLAGCDERLFRFSMANPDLRMAYHKVKVFGRNATTRLCMVSENMFAATSGSRLAFWDVDSPDCGHSVKAHDGMVADLQLSHNKKWLITAGDEGWVKLWDSSTRELVMMMRCFNDMGDYIFLTPDHYYKGSHNIAQYLNFSRGFDVFGVDQFDLQRNRPDIILERLGGAKEEVELLHQAWLKRLKKMGVDEKKVYGQVGEHAPVMEIVRQEQPASNQLHVKCKMLDTKYNLNKFFVSHNGTPLYGRFGKNMSKGMAKSVELTLSLVPGNNYFDFYCMNERGVESLHKQIVAYCEEPQSRPSLYVVAIGVSEYQEQQYNLNYAAKDAVDVVGAFQHAAKGCFERVKPLLITDKEFTAKKLGEIKSFLSSAQKSDVVVVFYAGHGILDNDFNYYLSTYETQFHNPGASSVAYERIEELLEGVKPLQKYFLIDACYSGEVEREDFVADNVTQVKASDVVFRSLPSATGDRRYKTSQVRRVFEDLFIDTRQGTGTTIVASAGGTEVAMEGNEWKNGLFTWCLKKGLGGDADHNHDSRITFGELIIHLRQQVTLLSGGSQSPSIRSENVWSDAVISRTNTQ